MGICVDETITPGASATQWMRPSSFPMSLHLMIQGAHDSVPSQGDLCTMTLS